MTSLSSIKDLEKDAITISDVLNAFTSVEIKGNRCQCPIHNGKDFNMSFSKQYFKCFVCNEGGDIFKLTQLLVGGDFKQVLSTINDTFNLGLPINQEQTKAQKCALNDKINNIRKEREQAERVEKRDKAHYDSLVQEFMRLDSNFYKYKPTNENEPLNPLFVEACHKRDYQKYKMEQML